MTSSYPRNIFLLRHTQTEWNAISRYQGQLDTELSSDGMQAVNVVASQVETGDFEIVYSSPLKRARTLAEAVAESAGAEVVVDPRLIEIAMGPWEGLLRSADRRALPGYASYLGRAPQSVVFPGGETLVELAARVLPFMEERFSGDSTRIAVVTHDSVVKVTIMLALGPRATTHLHRFRMRNGSISILRGRRLTGSVEVVDSVAHLTGSPFRLL